MLTIGQFATLCEITPKALRHYEKLGLFFPREIDPDTGYRYYDEDQVWELNELLSLKRSGFVLKTYKNFLNRIILVKLWQKSFNGKKQNFEKNLSKRIINY